MKTFIFLTLLFCSTVSEASAQTTMFHQDVAWSPDGKYIAFTGTRDFDRATNTYKVDIYVIGVDGSDLRRLTGDDANEYYTSWAKDRIAFSSEVRGSKVSDIFTVSPDGAEIRQITKGPGHNGTPSISRDGKRVVFASTRGGEKYQLYTMNADGSKVTRLTNDQRIAYFNPQFSPDGKRIVYYTEKGDGKDQICVMNSDCSNKTLLTANIGHNIYPGWSPDGKRIIFSSSKRDADSKGNYIDGSFLYTMNADGSGIKKLGNIKSFFARFSPDGKKIAYISGRFPETQIYVANADGSGAVKITK